MGLLDRERAIHDAFDGYAAFLRDTVSDANLAREMEVLRNVLLEGARRGLWSHGHTPGEQAKLYRKLRLRVTPEAEGDGIRLE